MIYGCTINGIHSSTLDLYLKSKSRPILPAIPDTYTQVAGRAGSYLTQQQAADRIIQVQFTSNNADLPSMRVSNRKIAAWLHTKERVRIIFDDEPDKFYYGKVDGVVDFEQFAASGVLMVTFRCQPFAAMVISTGADLTWEAANLPWCTAIPWAMVDAYRFTATGATSFAFTHLGTQELSYQSPKGSQSKIIITGSWTTLSLELNGKTLDYTASGAGTLIIDSANMEVTLDNVNKLDELEGDIDSFLTIEPGENTIEITGTGLDVTVTLDFVPLWL